MYYESELYHHGIKGQKWGVRRWQNSDGTFNAAGKERYFGNGAGENNKPVSSRKSNSSSVEKEHKGLTDKQKKALKIGAAVAGTALVAYGAYKLNQASTKALMDSYSEVGDIFTKSYLESHNDALSSIKYATEARNSGDHGLANRMFEKSKTVGAFGKIDQQEADRLYDKAFYKDFDKKERLDAAVRTLTKGADSFKSEKKSEIFKDSQRRTGNNRRKYIYSVP